MQKDAPKVFGKGLLPLPPGARYAHHHVLFGAMRAEMIPNTDFYSGHPIAIKNQEQYNFCPAFAKDAVIEDEVGVELDPLYSYARACQLLGKIQINGMSLLDICNEETSFGALEQDLAPYKVTDGQPAEFLANWKNFAESLDALAWEHQRPTALRIDTGPNDVFDNVRGTIYQNIDEHRAALTGALWRESWTNAPGGVIPEDYDPSEPGDGHAFKIFGQHIIGGVPYLVKQGSWGTDVGDKGLFYFPRSVVNREFTFGAFSFKNINPQKAQAYSDAGLRIDAGTVDKIKAIIANITKIF